MSAPEIVQPPPKPEVKQKPALPSKPTNGMSDSPPVDKGTLTRNPGNVLKMVTKFNQPDVQPPSETSGGAVNSSNFEKKAKSTPTVKPRMKATGPLQVKNDQAPPLPAKRRQTQKVEPEEENKTETVAGDQAQRDSLLPGDTDGTQSVPDGQEVEVQSVSQKPEKEPSTLSEPQCEKNCSCICHVQRPGMKLVWVLKSETEKEDERDENKQDNKMAENKDNESSGGEKESDTVEHDEEEELQMCSSDSSEEGSENETPLMNKKRFKATLDLIEGQLRRRSDPGPEAIFTSVKSLSQIPANLNKAHSVSEEESIYEVVIHGVPLSDKTPSAPLIQVSKPPLPSKSSSDGSPPAIPPRMPMDKNKSPLTPRNVPLHQLLGRPLSPKLIPLEHNPPNTPQPMRAPPPPPSKASGKRLSSQSHTLKDEEEGSAGGDIEKSNPKPSAHLTRQKSLDMEAHMPEELLYQIYTETYITKEIRRQTVCRNISKTSADFQMDHGLPRSSVCSGTGSVGTRSSPIPSLLQNTLWQDLPDVRDSGILQTLTSEECKYQESMFEVMTSEVSYLRSLRVMTEHFQESRELNDTLIILDKKTLFSNILRIREVSEKFLKDLEDRLNENLLIDDICDIISYHAQHNFPAYIDYVRNQVYQEKTFSTLMHTNPQFAAVILRLQESPKCQRLPFISFMLLPFQRITRIKMLVENILKRTAEGTEKEESASKALAAVSKIIDECNTQVGKMKQMEELIDITKKMGFDKLKAIPIISPNRFLEKRGELHEMAKGSTLFNLKTKFSPVYLFLFNDLLIIANKKGSERYVVMDYAHRSLVQVQTMSEDAATQNLENCFFLTMLENHQGKIFERLLKAPSQSDMHRWLAAFPNPQDLNREQEEVIYEDWDCPQVQCVERYVAKQTDELNLDPPEIINVVRKTNEGWCEGIRLSDGQMGWFPVVNVLEITNEHVRRRNLRERYRVMRAASAVTHKTQNL